MSASAVDTIYVGGNIITMNDHQLLVEAVAVGNGRIVGAGVQDDILKSGGPATKIVDLKGKTMLPAFIDGHSHFFQAAMIADYVNVSAPPVGPGDSIADIVGALKEHVAAKPVLAGEWLIGYGYDGSVLADGREATRDDFDKDFPDTPLLLVHVSGHGCILNSAGFRKVGIDANTPTPNGGLIVRRPGSNEPAGLLMEDAWFPVAMKLPTPSAQQLLENLGKAQQMYARAGYTTVQDAPVEPKAMPLYRKAADEGRFYLDLNGYWESHAFLGATLVDDFRNVRPSRYRLAGVKIVADGSPQGKTAYFTEPYLTGGPSGETNWRGTPTVTQEHMNEVVKKAYDNGAQVLVHCNGDATIDMLLNAHKAAGAPRDRRTTVIHSQFVRRDQLDEYVQLGVNPSFFTNHTFFWGDVHLRNLGKQRASFLSPMHTARWLGLHMTNHSDFLVTPLDTMLILWSAVNRVSRSGQIIGPEERISVLDGLKALTIDGAYQYFEEDCKGSIETGKLADLVILSDDPMKVAPMAIKDIKVVQTIKEGRTVYLRSEEQVTESAPELAGVGSR